MCYYSIVMATGWTTPRRLATFFVGNDSDMAVDVRETSVFLYSMSHPERHLTLNYIAWNELVVASDRIYKALRDFLFLPVTRYERCFVTIQIGWHNNLVYHVSSIPYEETGLDEGWGISFLADAWLQLTERFHCIHLLSSWLSDLPQ